MFLSRRIKLALTSALVLGTALAMVPGLSDAAPPGSRTVAASSPQTTAQRSAGSYTSKVSGTWRHGVVHGSFVPVRSFTRHGQDWVQGDLRATVRRNSGALVGRVTRHDLAVPVKASGAQLSSDTRTQQKATCSILHLVLGPLTLNLLGLHVHLNRVVLDITAQSGSGNLLGNLLCAVAHLLDGVSPSLLDIFRLGSLLNRIIGKIT